MGSVEMSQPLVFSIQHFCLHDGPGVRSVVFFKGCPLRCVWCQNPESYRTRPELGFKESLCVGCGKCVATCPDQALAAPGTRDPHRCQLCFECTRACPTLACVGFGQAYAVEAVLEELEPEQPLYRNSGGGVTLSGGEPFMHAAFALALTRNLRRDEVHVATETCGHFSPDGDAAALLAELDLVIYDLKVFDEQRHRAYCGVGNALIKSNFVDLARNRQVVLWPRLPLIPGVTDSPDDLERWADFLEQASIPYLTLVPYHNLGVAKRRWLGLPEAPTFQPLDEAQRNRAARRLERRGFAVFEPGEEEWSLLPE